MPIHPNETNCGAKITGVSAVYFLAKAGNYRFPLKNSSAAG